MDILDNDYIQARTDAMKMTQSSLQQLMTLSAGGLALYFSFIAKAPFLMSLQIVGMVVVWCWIASLCMAAIGHKLLGNMVISINNLSSTINGLSALSSLPDTVEAEIKKSVNPNAVVERAKNKLADAKTELQITQKAFDSVFFPMQDRVSFLVEWSLAAMVAGFIAIGIGYSVWVLN